MKTVFGVVEWIDDNSPILDDMSAFSTQEEAITMAKRLIGINEIPSGRPEIKRFSRTYTVIRIFVEEGLDERLRT